MVFSFFDLYFCFVVLLSDRSTVPKWIDGMTVAGACLPGLLIQEHILTSEVEFFCINVIFNSRKERLGLIIVGVGSGTTDYIEPRRFKRSKLAVPCRVNEKENLGKTRREGPKKCTESDFIMQFIVTSNSRLYRGLD